MHVSAMIQEFVLTGKDLRLAAMNGNREVVEQCLDAGINVDVADQHGNTSLILASDRGYVDIVDSLLDEGAKVNVAGHQHGITALMVASDKGHENIASLLLKYGAIIDEKNQHGPTTLMVASYGGHASIVDLLLNYVAYEIDEDMLSNVLKHAISKKNSDDNDTAKKMINTIGVLVKHGANLDITFEEEDNRSLFDLIRKNHPKNPTFIIEGAKEEANRCWREIVKTLGEIEMCLVIPNELIKEIADFTTNYYSS